MDGSFFKQKGPDKNSILGHGHFEVDDLCAAGRGGKAKRQEEFKNKKAKTVNESYHQKSNASRSSFQQKQKGTAPSSASAPTHKNKGEYYGQSSRVKTYLFTGSCGTWR